MSDMPTSTEIVFEAVRMLCEQGQEATRYTVQSLTGLAMTTVDDRIKHLHDGGNLRRPLKGRYEPAHRTKPNRTIKTTAYSDGSWAVNAEGVELRIQPEEVRALLRSDLPDGSVGYTLGEQSLTLSADEDRVLGQVLQANADARTASSGVSPSSVERLIDRLSQENRESRTTVGEVPENLGPDRHAARIASGYQARGYQAG